MLSDRIQTLSPSLTIAISSLARDLKAQGKDILSFSAGEPDFETPQRIKDEAIEAINSGFTQYTAVPGIPDPAVPAFLTGPANHAHNYSKYNLLRYPATQSLLYLHVIAVRFVFAHR